MPDFAKQKIQCAVCVSLGLSSLFTALIDLQILIQVFLHCQGVGITCIHLLFKGLHDNPVKFLIDRFIFKGGRFNGFVCDFVHGRKMVFRLDDRTAHKQFMKYQSQRENIGIGA